MSLAKNIRDRRFAKGWGPDELAHRAEVSRTALYQIECGRTEAPRAQTIRKIAEALDIPIDRLLAEAAFGEDGIPAPADPAVARRTRRPNGLSKEATADLDRKFHDLLASPLGASLAKLIEDSHRLLPRDRDGR